MSQGFEKFKEIVSDLFGSEEIRLDSKVLTGIGLVDILDVTSMIVALEEEFGVKIPDKEWHELLLRGTVGDVVDRLGAK